MSKVCEICGKGKVFGNKVTFSNKKISRSWAPNIRKVRAVVNGSVKRVNVCTRCLRSGYVERALLYHCIKNLNKASIFPKW